MLCEICNENEANVHIKQVIDGVARELHVCEECAAESNLAGSTPSSLTDFLFGSEQNIEPLDTRRDKKCPSCHMRRSDFKKLSRLGCSVCYETFMEDLTPLIVAVHRANRHVGKVPPYSKVNARIVKLQGLLENAVGSQDFEKAAELRDEIRLLEQKSDAENLEKKTK